MASAQECGENEEWKPEEPEGTCDNPHPEHPLGGPPGQSGCFCKRDCVRHDWGHGRGRQCIPVQECPVSTTAAPVASSSSSAAPSSSSSAPLVSVCAKIIPGICQVGNPLSVVHCDQACGLLVGVCAALPQLNLGALVCVCLS
ncbi:hypothetical protein AAVH_12243 [Aphelenchoides avenae]|nr:hypothetical protein AAVH_12243 [Aphelenchus avenae]